MLRAFYEWLVDNDLTPHLVVAATLPGVRVPVEFVQDGQIILNIAPRAVGQLELGNDAITFNARFSGRPHSVIVPVYAVQAICEWRWDYILNQKMLDDEDCRRRTVSNLHHGE